MDKLLFICTMTFLCGLSWAMTTQGDKNSSTAATTKPTPPTTHKHTTQPTTSATTLTPQEQCARANGSCEDCVKVSKAACVWCNSNKQCLHKNKLIPTDECALADARWAVCWLNYEALIIACSVIGGLLILGLTVCICCCCCCGKGNKAKWAREDAKVERQKIERKQKNADKKAERKAKTDEIRRKYGLIKDDTPYTRFNDEA